MILDACILLNHPIATSNHHASHLEIDYRTGQPTAVTGPGVSAFVRESCASLNESRTQGILAAIEEAASGESIPADGWASLVATRARSREVPLIPLEAFGILRNEEGDLETSNLLEMLSGQEARPFWDRDAGVVYKFFFLLPNGNLGRKLAFGMGGDGRFDLLPNLPATLRETVEKISVLHDAGAHPTEIVGLTETGDFLIVKQPLAAFQPYNKGTSSLPTEYLFHDDRREACHAIKAVECSGEGFRQQVMVISVKGAPYLVGDLHCRNIMRNALGEPTIIDALIGEITPAAMRESHSLALAVMRAARWRAEGVPPDYEDLLSCNDDEL